MSSIGLEVALVENKSDKSTDSRPHALNHFSSKKITPMHFWLISSSFSFADVLDNIFRWHCPTGIRSKEIIFKRAREKEDDEAQGRFNLHQDSWEYGNTSPSFHYVNSIDDENSACEESMNMTWAWR